MKPATKRLIESRIREMHQRAISEDERAAFEEGEAHGRRVHANECREVAAELQALLDAALAEPALAPHHSWTVDGKPLTEALAQREVQHVDTPDEEPAGIPPHVWLYRNMLTELQAVAPLGRDETNGQYAVAIDQLTSEQVLIPHVQKQMREIHDAEYLGRLGG